MVTRFNYYTIASFPKLTWESELPMTLSEFLADYEEQLEPVRDALSDVLLLNDVKNLEIIVRSKLVDKLPEHLRGNTKGEPLQFYRARYVEPEELEHFIEDPFVNKPHPNYPEFLSEFFTVHKTPEEQYENIENLYISYFAYLQTRENRFLRYYGRIATTIRTVLAAMRIMKAGLDLETYLNGDPEIVQIILENRTNADLGLKTILPEVSQIISLFDKEPIELEHYLDKIRFDLMEQVGKESPFGDHIILSYLIAFQVRNRWNFLDKKAGEEILQKIVEGKI